MFVIPKRFERLTHALEGRCSIQLSYGTDLYVRKCACDPFPCAKIVCLSSRTKDFFAFFDVRFQELCQVSIMGMLLPLWFNLFNKSIE